jgi:hypothetical protein
MRREEPEGDNNKCFEDMKKDIIPPSTITFSDLKV